MKMQEIEKQEAVEWLSYLYDGEFSELGQNVALLLSKMWGLHNISTTSLSKANWGHERWIEVNISKPLSTVDSSDLTRLVVYAHQMLLRVELRGSAPGHICIQFHQRKSRDYNDGFWKWCPTIEDHVAMIVSDTYPGR